MVKYHSLIEGLSVIKNIILLGDPLWLTGEGVVGVVSKRASNVFEMKSEGGWLFDRLPLPDINNDFAFLSLISLVLSLIYH